MRTNRWFPIIFLAVVFALIGAGCRSNAGGNVTEPPTPTAAAKLVFPSAAPTEVKADTPVPTQLKATAQPAATLAAARATATLDVSAAADDVLKVLDQLDAANQSGDNLADVP
jgi:hypothetical protein